MLFVRESVFLLSKSSEHFWTITRNSVLLFVVMIWQACLGLKFGDGITRLGSGFSLSISGNLAALNAVDIWLNPDLVLNSIRISY